jgi:hypothetical protein
MRSPAYCTACCNVQYFLHHDFVRVQLRAHMVCAAYNRSPHCPVPHLRLPLARPFLGLRCDCAARAPEQARATAQAAPCVYIRQLGTCILACYREVPTCYAAGLKSRRCGGFRRHPRLFPTRAALGVIRRAALSHACRPRCPASLLRAAGSRRRIHRVTGSTEALPACVRVLLHLRGRSIVIMIMMMARPAGRNSAARPSPSSQTRRRTLSLAVGLLGAALLVGTTAQPTYYMNSNNGATVYVGATTPSVNVITSSGSCEYAFSTGAAADAAAGRAGRTAARRVPFPFASAAR